MPKRKRSVKEIDLKVNIGGHSLQAHPAKSPVHIQIVAGSYNRVLHGITASIPYDLLLATSLPKEDFAVQFSDSFLFNAHTSAIKCLALSPLPPKTATTQKVLLATGSTDERINIFHLSTRSPPHLSTRSPPGPILSSLSSSVQTNHVNRSLGILHTHNASITALHFPNRAKLISTCGNNIIAVTSTKNFNTLLLMKSPNPTHPNRPSGDTSTSSTLPAGVNDFAVHPSMKLMITVGRAEKCMRLWNLVTGKKAGVLNFDKAMLQEMGEHGNKWTTTEGRKILWDPTGKEFAIAFDAGVCTFGMDCKPKRLIHPATKTKVHQLRYVPGLDRPVLAMSTENGCVFFYSTTEDSESSSSKMNGDSGPSFHIPPCKLLGQLGGVQEGVFGRIKDFDILNIAMDEESSPLPAALLVITAGSDGSIRVWAIGRNELVEFAEPDHKTEATEATPKLRPIGRLLGVYETQNRITCMKSFVLNSSSEDSEHGDSLDDLPSDIPSSF